MQFILLETPQTGGGIGTIVMMVAMVGLVYFMMIRPQKKREKETKEMRGNIEIGDSVTTIGGIVGIVANVKEDTLLIEAGSDKTKIRVMRWAVQEVQKLQIEETSSASSTSDSK